ncbi:MAG: hypothetical protein LLF99_16275 [Desulfobacteraceae bacterium]|nr:hypothetical protein [Desulfobacteraceae bacterium]
MKIAVTVDVEEEGLFSGRYPREPAGVRNVEALRRLEFIPREFGFPLTLLPTYPVCRDPRCREILAEWRDRRGAEIGAHLHPWNTPPFADLGLPEPIPSDLLPSDLLREKLETLLATVEREFGLRPQSFRMGRFDLGRQVSALLPEHGIKLDSSIVPARRVPDGPDHFLAPERPYLLESSSGGRAVLEAPLTLVSVFPRARERLYSLASVLRPEKAAMLFSAYRSVAVAGIQPAWFPLSSMKLAVRLHRRRGGRVLVMFLHSSELLPGATPGFRTGAAVERLVSKLRSFLHWLVRTSSVEGIVLSGLSSFPDAGGVRSGPPRG